MKVPGIHPPDPDDPKGMAFIFAAGFVDPRKGGKPNQMLVLKESWEPTSAMYWALGLRYHPDLATKWVDGGGQFTLGMLVDKPPDEPELQEMAEAFAKDQYRQMVDEIERVKKHGTPYEKRRLHQRFQQAGAQAMQMAEMLKEAAEEEEGEE